MLASYAVIGSIASTIPKLQTGHEKAWVLVSNFFGKFKTVFNVPNKLLTRIQDFS